MAFFRHFSPSFTWMIVRFETSEKARNSLHNHTTMWLYVQRAARCFKQTIRPAMIVESCISPSSFLASPSPRSPFDVRALQPKSDHDEIIAMFLMFRPPEREQFKLMFVISGES